MEQTSCEQLNSRAVFGELLLFVPGHKHTCYKIELGHWNLPFPLPLPFTGNRKHRLHCHISFPATEEQMSL